ncbi:MAG: transporter substrate-binding domain-containing protein [Microcoleaceae cyanobacterium MO_207.B10]|nr:transporter substrate-binding domain-containing protein [Microcoleaceae cyanobacterium MO_207.B10]
MFGSIKLKILIVIGYVFSLTLPVQAEKLRVGVLGTSPFIINDQGKITGIAVDVWDEIAADAELEYELVYLKQDVSLGLDALASNKLDVIIGSVSMTADRMQKVEFSYPFFQAEIGLLIPKNPPSLWSRIKPFLGWAFISSIGLLMLSLFIVGTLIWMIENKRNSQHFPKEFGRGVGNGMWFAIVTLTTVGYGDKTPITPLGRFITGVWMLITTVTASSLTAGIATTLTLSLSNQGIEIFKSPDDLREARIAVIRGSTGVRWAKRSKARLTEADTLKQAVEFLADEKVDGVVFDSPAMRYYLKQNPHLPFKLADFALADEYYGFVFPLNNALVRQVNISLIKLENFGEIEEIFDKWLQ